MSKRIWWLSAGAVALVAVLVVGLLQAGSSSEPDLKPLALTPAQIQAKLAGAPAALAALHGQANALLPGRADAVHARLAALRGHPVVVNLWAAWCGPCRAELPVLQRASLSWGKRVAFVGIDVMDNRDDARRLLRDIPVAYPSYEDPDGDLFAQYHLSGAPATAFYDAAGRLVTIHQGPYRSLEDLDAHIERYAIQGHP